LTRSSQPPLSHRCLFAVRAHAGADDTAFTTKSRGQRADSATAQAALIPRIPHFAQQLSPHVVQLHSSQYRNPAQLPAGDVLVVDGTRHSPHAVVWATGFRPHHPWLEVPVLDDLGAPVQVEGVTSWPGLYFLGLP
jgi:hypothetical protein